MRLSGFLGKHGLRTMLVLITELIFTKNHYNEYKIEDQLDFLAHGGTQKRMCALYSTCISETN